jgi:bacteriorhodopsin
MKIFIIITIPIFQKLFYITMATDLNIINITLYSFYFDLVLFYTKYPH